MHTIKPIDKDAVVHAAKLSGNIITVEDHNILGGLGASWPTPCSRRAVFAKLKKIGVPDKFIEFGYPEEIYPGPRHRTPTATTKLRLEVPSEVSGQSCRESSEKSFNGVTSGDGGETAGAGSDHLRSNGNAPTGAFPQTGKEKGMRPIIGNSCSSARSATLQKHTNWELESKGGEMPMHRNYLADRTEVGIKIIYYPQILRTLMPTP